MDRQRETFNQFIKTIDQRSRDLRQSVMNSEWEKPQLVLECLQELQNALEELQTAEEELRQQNEELLLTQQLLDMERQRYQELFEFAPDGYLITDIYGTVREANWIAASLLSIHQKHLLGKPLISFVIEPQRRSFRALLNQLPMINRVEEWEVQMCGRSGHSFDAALTVETIRNDQGQATGLRWLVRDITSRKQSEEKLQQMQLQNLELMESDRLKSQFIATISHELRTPMNAILGFSELLLRRCRHQHDEHLAIMIERISRNGKHLLAMIEEMLDFSKLQSQRLQLQLQSFNLGGLVTATVDDMRSLAEQKMLAVQISLPQRELIVVNDPIRLRQVLVNLICNAIKFTETGSVKVEVHELPESRILIAISDTGIGIAPEEHTRIFQEFWQSNQTTSRSHGGTGLGLAISKSLVELMQGSISVESQISEGSTFRIEIPYRVEPS